MTAPKSSPSAVSARAGRLLAEALVWDAHSCLPLKPGVDCSELARHRAAGFDYVSINVGMDFNPVAQCVHVLATFRAWIVARPAEFRLAGSIADVLAAKASGQLAVSFDLEGSDMLRSEERRVGKECGL